MDIMTLAAKLQLDDTGFREGIKDAESAGERLSGKMSSMAVAVGNLAADLAKKGFGIVKNLIGGAIDAYADYEQLIGGVETLFKRNSDTVAKHAKEAYRTAGISANQYMETVTSFSASLLQGLQGDTEQAAEIADMAIRDMADNANKMGTDMSSIMVAYQGFAKQNYTMLDNLKLGYGGTAEEMLRLVNESGILDHEIKSLDEITFAQLVQAIHQIQEEMGITGTTAKEAADTISGSKSSLVAAWKDLLSVIGGEGDQKRLDETLENFKTSFSTYMKNFIPTLVKTIAGSGDLVSGIAEAIADLPTDLLTQGFYAATEGATNMVNSLTGVVEWLIHSLIDLFSNVTAHPELLEEFATAIGEFIGNTISELVEHADQIILGLTKLGLAIGASLVTHIVEGIWNGLFGSDAENGIAKIEREAERTVVSAELATAKATAILQHMEDLHTKYGDAVKDSKEWAQAEADLEKVLGGSGEVFEQYGSDIQGAIKHLKDMAEELRKLAIQNAMQERLAATYKLMAEATINRDEAEYKAESARLEMQVLDDRRNASALAYARKLSTSKTLEGEEAEVVKHALEDPTHAYEWVDKLAEAMEIRFTTHEWGDEDKIWDESEIDDILSPAALEAMESEFARLSDVVAQAEKDIDKYNSEIETYEGKIVTYEAVVEKLAREMGELSIAVGNAKVNLYSLAILKPSYSMDDGEGVVRKGVVYMPRAVGLDYAPEGLRTELHQGEAILTKEENAARRGGYTPAEMEAALEYAIERSIARMQINMSGEKVGDITTRRVNRNISGSEHARVRAMGG